MTERRCGSISVQKLGGPVAGIVRTRERDAGRSCSFSFCAGRTFTNHVPEAHTKEDAMQRCATYRTGCMSAAVARPLVGCRVTDIKCDHASLKRARLVIRGLSGKGSLQQGRQHHLRLHLADYGDRWSARPPERVPPGQVLV